MGVLPQFKTTLGKTSVSHEQLSEADSKGSVIILDPVILFFALIR